MRLVLYGFLLFILLLLQAAVLPRWTVAGVHPLWPPVLVFFAAVRQGERFGLVFGLAAGLLCDALIPPGQGFFALYLMTAGFILGKGAEKVFSKSFPVSLAGAAAAFALMELLYFCFLFLMTGRAGPSALLSVALPETLFSLLSGLWLYLPVKWLGRRRQR